MTRSPRVSGPEGLRVGLALLMVLLPACDADRVGRASAVSHPTPTNEPSDPSRIAAGHTTDGVSDSLLSTARRLASAEPEWSFGDAEGDRIEMFGTIEDAVLSADGRLYVLDSRYNDVTVLHEDGRPLGTFAGPGEGPGELGSPEALALTGDGDSTILVADRGARIEEFRSQGSTAMHVATRRVEFLPEDLCELDGSLYVMSWRPSGQVIHRIGSDGGSIEHSFGDAYRSEESLVSEQLSEGPIGCLEGPRRIVVGFESLPYLRSYGLDGSRAWTARVEDFLQRDIVQRSSPEGNPAIVFSSDEPFELLATLEPIGAGEQLLLQTVRLTRRDASRRLEIERVRSYIVSAENGKGVLASDSLPLIQAADDERLVTIRHLPHPRLILYRW